MRSLNVSQGPIPLEVSLEGGSLTEKWIQAKVSARQIGDAINRIRREHRMPDSPPIQLEHGPEKSNFMIDFLLIKAYERS